MKKKTRNHKKWRVDYDYKGKLSKEDKSWLDKFTDEYYRCEFKDEPIHNEEQKKDLISNETVARRDLLTKHPEQISKNKPTNTDRKYVSAIRFYTEEDYRKETGSPEEALINFIDKTNKNTNKTTKEESSHLENPWKQSFVYQICTSPIIIKTQLLFLKLLRRNTDQKE